MVATTPPLFDVRGLRIVYRRSGAKPLEAVKGVDFTLAEGETLGIVGESGSSTRRGGARPGGVPIGATCRWCFRTPPARSTPA